MTIVDLHPTVHKKLWKFKINQEDCKSLSDAIGKLIENEERRNSQESN